MLMLVATISLSFSACSDDDKPNVKSLTGTWIGHQDDDPEGEGFIYMFNSDGTGTAHWDSPGSRIDPFTKYEIRNGHLLIMWEGDDEYENKGTIIINGDTFKQNFYDRDDWWTFVKQ